MRPLGEVVGHRLAERMLTASPRRQRDLAVCAASAAQTSAGLEDPTLTRAVDDLMRLGPEERTRSAAGTVASRLRERASQLNAAAKINATAGDEPARAIRHALAATAVEACFAPDPAEALGAAVDAADRAVDHDPRLPELLSFELDGIDTGNGWAARSLAQLVFPRFLDVDGYILLAHQGSPETVAHWRAELPDRPGAVENVINHVHVHGGLRDRAPAALGDALAERLVVIWTEALGRAGLADRAHVHLATTEPGDWIITAHRDA